LSPHGIPGERGSQGIQGERGEKGDSGGVEPSVSASLTSTFTDNWLGTDYHDVEGLIINFGSDPAYDVVITVTWHKIGGEFTGEPVHLGFLSGHRIYEYSRRYEIEGDFNDITWEITWS
ncbi:unnamed protein product, partial [marine sediment metagenome]